VGGGLDELQRQLAQRLRVRRRGDVRKRGRVLHSSARPGRWRKSDKRK
jgi:hypothetical protein